MNFDALNEIIRKNLPKGLDICPICGCPFRPYHSRQKTCGTEECMRAWHNKYLEESRRDKLTNSPEEFREYRRDAMRKHRKKKKEAEIMRRNYNSLEDYWTRQAAEEERVLDGGVEYGKKQVEKTLAQVPKIDTSGFEKREK